MKYYHCKSFLIFVFICQVQNFVAQNNETAEKVPGIVINHYPAQTKLYIGSPSICILPCGEYIASHDLFGPASTGNQTFIFYSEDKGLNWHKISQVKQFWSGLFYHNNALYLMGVNKIYGDVVIRKSTDKGRTWTEPLDEKTGLLFKASDSAGYHTAPVPVVVQHNRIWRGMEFVKNVNPNKWGNFEALMLSAPLGADLLDAANWTASNHFTFQKNWTTGSAWLEGNAVVTNAGEVVNILRVHNKTDDIAAVMSIDKNGKELRFDSVNGFIKLFGACKKFTIRQNPHNKMYYTFTNAIPDEYLGGNVERTRNSLYLLSSKDLINWKKERIVLQSKNINKEGFQYIDWQFDGDEFVFVSRTSFIDSTGGADSQHNANYLTFHRLKMDK